MENNITVKMMTLDGVDFEVATSGDQESQRLALFLHGFPQTFHSWRHQMHLLSQQGYKCWAPNQRGYGKSFSPPNIKSYAIELLVSDVAKFIDAANCKYVVLIGHDWGGTVAWYFSLLAKRKIDRLVIMNVPHPAILSEELKNIRQMFRSWYVFSFQIPYLTEYILTRNNAQKIRNVIKNTFCHKNSLTEKDLEIYQKNALRKGGITAMVNWYRAKLQTPSPKIDGILIEVPTLLIWGEKDPYFCKYLAERTNEVVKNLTTYFIPNASHFVNEDDYENTNQILTDWLQKAY